MELNANEKVSIIIPVYDVEQYIRECVDSIISQTYANIEIIFVDDGSPDNCGKICNKYAEMDSRIKIIHKENGGVSSARNVGIDNATGDWIYFCDPDDWIEPDLIEKSIGLAEKNNCDMCIFDFAEVYKDKINYFKALKHNDNVFKELNDINIFIAYACAMGSVCNVITKSGIIKELRFDEEISFREDEIFRWKLYSRINSFCYLRENLYYYRINPNSATNSISLNKLKSMIIKIYQKEKEIVNCNVYPLNSVQAVCSKYLEVFWFICVHTFNEKKPLSYRISSYREYVSGVEFKESITNFNDLYFSGFNKICLKNKKAPHWLFIYLLVKVNNIRIMFGKKYRR